MRPRNVGPEDIRFWEEWGSEVTWEIGPMLGKHVGAEDVETVLKGRDPRTGQLVVKVAWERDERDGGGLEDGVTVWTTFWGGMLPTDLVVVHGEEPACCA